MTDNLVADATPASYSESDNITHFQRIKLIQRIASTFVSMQREHSSTTLGISISERFASSRKVSSGDSMRAASTVRTVRLKNSYLDVDIETIKRWLDSGPMAVKSVKVDIAQPYTFPVPDYTIPFLEGVPSKSVERNKFAIVLSREP
jgi:hypothetical protein